MGSKEGRLSVVSTGVLVLMRSACKDMMLGGASVDDISQNLKLVCFVPRVAAEVPKDRNGLFSAVS